MGKTAVFVLSVLQQLDPVDGEVGAIVICHTRELAYQICHEFERFSVYLPGEKKERREEEEIFFSSRFERSGQRSEEAFSCSPFSFFGFSFFLPFSNREKQNSLPILFPSSFLPSEKTTGVRVANFFGGLPIKQHKDILRGAAPPHIVVGTPGRVKQLAKEGDLKLGSLRHFVIDECDKVREIRREDREGKMRERELDDSHVIIALSPFLSFPLIHPPHTKKTGSRQRRDAL